LSSNGNFQPIKTSHQHAATTRDCKSQQVERKELRKLFPTAGK